MQKYVLHALLAAGAGCAVFLGQLAQINDNPYVQAGAAAGIVFLGAVGAGVAKRSNP